MERLDTSKMTLGQLKDYVAKLQSENKSLEGELKYIKHAKWTDGHGTALHDVYNKLINVLDVVEDIKDDIGGINDEEYYEEVDNEG